MTYRRPEFNDSDDGPRVEGYLFKKSSGRVHRWQKRYFILDPPRLTQCPTSEAKPTKIIDLRKVHFVREKNPRNPKEGGFEIGYGHNLLHLRAESSDTCIHWLRMIQSAVAPHQAIGSALAQINENACPTEDDERDEPDGLYNHPRSSGNMYCAIEGNSNEPTEANSSRSSSISSCMSPTSDVDSAYFAPQTDRLLSEVDDCSDNAQVEFGETPGEFRDIMEVIPDEWRRSRNPDLFLITVAVKFEDWLVLQEDRYAREGLPLVLISEQWEKLLLWYLKLKHQQADLERTILTSFEVSLCEDMKEKIKGDLNRRLPLHDVPRRKQPGSNKEVPCSEAGNSLSNFVIRGESMKHEPAKDRFTYALIGVLNFSSLMLRRQFVTLAESRGVWGKLHPSSARIPITALATQVNDCLFFSLMAKRLQQKNSSFLPCFEAFEKAFLVLVNDACKIWADHFRHTTATQKLTQKLWSNLEGKDDVFDNLCKSTKAFLVDQERHILPEAFLCLEIQVVRRALVLPMLSYMRRNAPLNKITSHWSKPSGELNKAAAKLLKQHIKSIETVFRPSKASGKLMGIHALHDVKAFLVNDAAVLPDTFVMINATLGCDFVHRHAQRLLGWRCDLSQATRHEVSVCLKRQANAGDLRSKKKSTKEFGCARENINRTSELLYKSLRARCKNVAKSRKTS